MHDAVSGLVVTGLCTNKIHSVLTLGHMTLTRDSFWLDNVASFCHSCHVVSWLYAQFYM